MHDNFESLLKRCKAYQRKRLMIRLGGLSLIVLMLVGSLWLYQYSTVFDEASPSIVKIEKKALPVTPPSKPDNQKPQVQAVAADKVVPKQEQAQSTSIKETHAVTRKDVTYELSVDESYLAAMSQKEVQKTPQVKIKPKPKELKKVKRLKAPVKQALHVSEKTSQQTLSVSTKKLISIDDLRRQYEKEPQYDLALKISQAYYDEKKFSKASTWAKKANMIDRERDEAWMMYAKSEYARGNKARAKDILSLYLANKPSKDIEMLLMTWNQEK